MADTATPPDVQPAIALPPMPLQTPAALNLQRVIDTSRHEAAERAANVKRLRATLTEFDSPRAASIAEAAARRLGFKSMTGNESQAKAELEAELAQEEAALLAAQDRYDTAVAQRGDVVRQATEEVRAQVTAIFADTVSKALALVDQIDVHRETMARLATYRLLDDPRMLHAQLGTVIEMVRRSAAKYGVGK